MRPHGGLGAILAVLKAQKPGQLIEVKDLIRENPVRYSVSLIHDLNGITAIKFLERHFAPTRMAVMQKHGHVTKHRRGRGETGRLLHCYGE